MIFSVPLQNENWSYFISFAPFIGICLRILASLESSSTSPHIQSNYSGASVNGTCLSFLRLRCGA